jgi:poly(beta-D-mannuronate) lyase
LGIRDDRARATITKVAREQPLRRMAGWLLLLTLVLPSWQGRAALFSQEQRAALDLSGYVVTDPSAGYFDVAARRAFLARTDDSILLAQMAELGHEVACERKLALQVVKDELRLPGFYDAPDAWSAAVEPLFAFEDAVSRLAGGYVATGDDAYASCLLDLLGQWAAADALMRFYHTSDDQQAWFNIEDMLFAAGLAWSVVRDQVPGRTADKTRIDRWLVRAAKNHLSIEAGPSSCCNNHFYRRALYAAIIGVVADDDALFQVGVSALYSALHELTAEGALPREVARGRRAAHYQNYGLLYLVPIAQIIERQGYPAFDLRVDGHSLHDAMGFAIDVLEDPTRLGDLAPHQQDFWFIRDPQYFAWMEIWLSRFDAPRLERFVAPRRPIHNRSAGGYVTVFFWKPDRS